jgi:hypothetical protein
MTTSAFKYYCVLGLLAFGLFAMWQRDVNKTKQLDLVMNNPVERFVQGPTVVKEVIKRENETIIRETRDSGYLRDISYKDIDASRTLIAIGYTLKSDVSLTLCRRVGPIYVGPSISYNIERGDMVVGAKVMVRF